MKKLLFLACFFVSLQSTAGVLLVSNNNDSGTGSLRDQILAATPGDTVLINVSGTIELAAQIGMNNISNVTIIGAYPAHTTITPQAGFTGNMFYVQDCANLSFENIGFEGIASNVNAFEFSNNATGPVSFRNCLFENWNGSGAMYVASTDLNLINCSFFNNSSLLEGGAIYVESGNFKSVNCTYSGNTSSDKGGAIYFGNNTTPTHLINNTFVFNDAPAAGAAVYADVSAGPIIMLLNAISDNGITVEQFTTISGSAFQSDGGNILNFNGSAEDISWMAAAGDNSGNLTMSFHSPEVIDGYGLKYYTITDINSACVDISITPAFVTSPQNDCRRAPRPLTGDAGPLKDAGACEYTQLRVISNGSDEFFPGSLPWAIAQNFDPVNYIEFDIPIISLPTIISPDLLMNESQFTTIVDGFSQTNSMIPGPEATNNPGVLGAIIPITVQDANSLSYGIQFGSLASESSVSGLRFTNFVNYGIDTDGCNNLEVFGCEFGLNGTTTTPNGSAGIHISGSSNCEIGGVMHWRRNVLSGNGSSGDHTNILIDPGSDGTRIAGNIIGLTADGLGSVLGMPTSSGGILNRSSNISIGHNSTNGGNVISGFPDYGIQIYGGNDTKIRNNIIGLDYEGVTAFPNFNGVVLDGVCTNVTLGGVHNTKSRNIIAGNQSANVWVTGVNSCKIIGNFIGVDISGTNAVSGSNYGIEVNGLTVNDLTIGDLGANSGNVISGNGIGIRFITSSGASSVLNNYIGLDYTGTVAIPGQQYGVQIDNGAFQVAVGLPNEGNVISGHSNASDAGIRISSGANNHFVQGNKIGTDVSGAFAIANTVGIKVLGNNNNLGGILTNNEGNLVSGNSQYGFDVAAGTGNNIEGNLIGTDVTGTTAIPNLLIGVKIFSANNTTIGGAGGRGNIISGNTTGNGITLDGTGTGTTVLGNRIGTTVTGTAALANNIGIILNGTHNATIGSGPTEENYICANTLGIDINSPSNVIDGNYVGIGVGGVTAGMGNGEGLNVSTANNIIGQNVSYINVFSNNTGNGIYLEGDGADNNQINNCLVGYNGSGGVAGNGGHGIIVNGGDGNYFGNIIQNSIGANTGKAMFLMNNANYNEVITNKFGNTDGIAGSENADHVLVVEGSDFNIIGSLSLGSGNHFGTTLSGYYAIELTDADSNKVRGNFIGIDASNNSFVCGVGINIVNNSKGNVIGKDWNGFGEGNVISNIEYQSMQVFQSSNGNIIAGNKFGTNVSGTSVSQNQMGIVIGQNSQFNQVGGDKTLGLGNLISGCFEGGISISSDSNFVYGNKIGMDISMSNAFSIQDDGVSIENGAQGCIIGGDRATLGNYIDGNMNTGIKISDSPNNQVLGNIIGGVANSTQVYGVEITGPSSVNNVIGSSPLSDLGNFIYGHDAAGLFTSNSASANIIKCNVIGLDTTNNLSYFQYAGIQTASNSGVNVIGESTLGNGNVISGNDLGVLIDASSNQVIQNNIIGLDTTGVNSRPNTDSGVLIVSGASNNTVGGTGALEGNYVSGNTTGIKITSSGSSDNEVLGNIIGLNLSSIATPNQVGVMIEAQATNNSIGNSTIGNNISGNYIGVGIEGTGTTANKVVKNFIGESAANTYGVVIFDNASGNFVGEGTAATRNIIVNNDSVGVAIVNATGNNIIGNYIGVSGDGITANGNLLGMFLQDADNNQIGNFGSEEGNLVSGNSIAGIALNQGSDGNTLMNNYVGTDFTGNSSNAALANPSGIVLYGASGNFIGGDWNNNEGNVVCGNTDFGIHIDSSVTNEIIGNNIGLSKDNDTYIGNGITGILFTNGADANNIGSTTNGEENVITANASHGIRIVNSSANSIEGNFIGNDDLGGGGGVSNGVNNQLVGVSLDTGAVSNNIIDVNVISGNSNYGIGLNGPGCELNTIKGNHIGLDASGNIGLPNTQMNIYVSNGASHNTIGGTATNYIGGNVNTEHIRIFGVGTDSNTVKNNYINFALNGITTFSANNGVSVQSNANGNTIGGNGPNDGNLIGGLTQDGIEIDNSNFTTILGNTIGLDLTSSPAPISGSGINFFGGDNSWVGAELVGSDSANVITNCNTGITVQNNGANAALNNAIKGNSIYNNTEQGIDLLGDNLVMPIDTNNSNIFISNLGIDRPEIISGWTCDDGNTHLGFKFYASNMIMGYSIQIYRNPSPDLSGFGEGEEYIGNYVFNPNAPYDTVDVDLGIALNVGDVITATITGVTDNTSEFSEQFTITSAPVYNPPTTVTESCLGADNGEIEIFADGAIESSIDGGVTIYQQVDGDTIMAPAGTYQADVMYVNGCIQSQTVVLPAGVPLDFNYTVVDDTCGLGFGSIEIDTVITNTNGGSGDYSYSFNNGSAYLTDIDTTGLLTGTFDIGLVDNTLGCFSNLDQITVGNITDVADESFDFDSFCPGDTPVPYNVATGGGTWTVDNSGGINATTGELTTYVEGQTYNITYEVGICMEQSVVSVTANALDDATFTYPDYCLGNTPTVTPALPGGTFSILSGPGTNIDAVSGEIFDVGGEYDVQYTTNGPCPASWNDTVFVFDAIVAPAISVFDSIFCVDEVITAMTTPGVTGDTYTWFDDQLNALGSGTSYTPTTLNPGVNEFFLNSQNVNGCVSDYSSINYILSDTSLMYAGPDAVACIGSDISLSAEGGVSYLWTASTQIIDDLDEQYPVANISFIEDFYVTITDEYGCTKVDVLSVTLDDPANCNVEVYNAFSPNGDGSNDVWLIDGIEGFPVNTVKIYNRWGDVIAEFTDYNNTTVVWDGLSKSGLTVPAGTYFYIVEVGGTQNQGGWLQIVK
ncbi:MAG: gliding motility-associated C-terminal domain-containing protein [Crocinitomicaceae bacterium]